MIIGNAASETQEGIVVKEGTNDRDYTTGTSSNNSTVPWTFRNTNMENHEPNEDRS